MITFRVVDPEYGPDAYQAHADFTADNPAVLPRTRHQFLSLVDEGLVWAAVDDELGLVGLSYSRFSDADQEWEIGGLMVTASARGKGVGAILMALTLGDLLFNQDPLSAQRRPKILAHVLKSNPMPRGIIVDFLRFEWVRDVKIPGERLPGLPVEADGCVHGDEFHIGLPETLRVLADFAERWHGELRNGEPADIDMFEGVSLGLWAEAFIEMEANL